MHVERGHFIFIVQVPITFCSRTILQELGKPVYMHYILRIQANMMLSNYKHWLHAVTQKLQLH